MNPSQVFRTTWTQSNSEYNNYGKFDYQTPQMTTKTDDELFVETWLTKHGKMNVNLDSTKHKLVQKSNFGIHHAKSELKKCFEITCQLEAIHKVMKESAETMDTEEWRRHSIEIGHLKEEQSNLLAQFQQNGVMERLKHDIHQRKKKRLTQKRRRANAKHQKTQKEKDLQMRHKKIDLWLVSKKEQAERAQAEENSKREADCVLAEVTKKKADARKQLSLLAGLVKLRTVREQMVNAQGRHLSISENANFANITETLVTSWEKSIKSSTIEEQCLQSKLKRSASEDSKMVHANRERDNEAEWDEVLFGPKHPPSELYWRFTAAQRDMEVFIANRKSWDTFLTTDPNTKFKIPLGWVLPEPIPSFEWSCFKKNS